ncbi:MAG: DUF1648 domain-containing protein [Lachnospiraceae bacterium]|nr:DUF1648 domain-containing protein [Lachnospiraceae bacterium]
MKNKKLRIINYLIVVTVLAAVTVIYPRLPEQIPTNWGFDGTITYGAKYNIWIIVGMLPLFAVLFDVLPHIDPRRSNYQKFSRFYDGFCIGFQLFLTVVIGIIISESLFPGRLHTGKIIFFLLSLMFLLIGNYLPKIQSNFYMGIKTPWTLSSDDVWRKTHRLGGKLYAACGILTLLSTLFLPFYISGIVLLVLVFGSTLAVTLASWIWWRKEQHELEK